MTDSKIWYKLYDMKDKEVIALQKKSEEEAIAENTEMAGTKATGNENFFKVWMPEEQAEDCIQRCFSRLP